RATRPSSRYRPALRLRRHCVPAQSQTSSPADRPAPPGTEPRSPGPAAWRLLLIVLAFSSLPPRDAVVSWSLLLPTHYLLGLSWRLSERLSDCRSDRYSNWLVTRPVAAGWL